MATPALPVRVYEAGEQIMIAAPMAGRAPENIAVTVEATRGERVGPAGRVPTPMTTGQQRCSKHAA